MVGQLGHQNHAAERLCDRADKARTANDQKPRRANHVGEVDAVKHFDDGRTPMTIVVVGRPTGRLLVIAGRKRRATNMTWMTSRMFASRPVGDGALSISFASSLLDELRGVGAQQRRGDERHRDGDEVDVEAGEGEEMDAGEY